MAQDSTLVAPLDDQERFAAVTSPSAADATDAESADVIAARERIEHARSEMSDTIDAIKERLSPAHIAEEAKEAAVDTVKDVADAIKEKATDFAVTVQEKAAPVVEAVQEKTAQAMDVVRDAAHKLGEKVNEAKSHIPSPEERTEMIRSAKSAVTHSVSDFGGAFMDTIKANPLPAAIAGFGLGWLLVSMQRQRSAATTYSSQSDYVSDDFEGKEITPSQIAAQRFEVARNGNGSSDYANGNGLKERASDFAHNVGDKASDLAGTVKDKASDFAHGVSDKASDLAGNVSAKAGELKGRASEFAGGVKDKASDFAQGVGSKASDLADATKGQYKVAADGLDRFIDEQPLAAGAIALLIGAAVGILVPATTKENQWFGPKRDELLDQATGVVQDAAKKAQTVAQVALGQARDGLGQTLEQAKQQIQQTVDQTKETVKTEAQHQGLTAAAA